jgi:CBS domain-containing protein
MNTSKRHLTVQDVMTSDVITARPLDGFKEVAVRLFDSGVSALPVVDDSGRVLGVISEADLLLKERAQANKPHAVRRQTRLDNRKAQARTASEAMTRPAITVRPELTVAEAARVMHQFGLKHLPVVDVDNRLVGVVSRHDLIQVFSRSDESIRQEVVEGVFGHDLMMDTLGVTVEVSAGVVCVSGEVDRKTEIPIVSILVAAMDGVVAVDNALTYRWDDSKFELLDGLPHGRVAGLG